METKEIKVFGRVQGVFFRANTQEKAQQLGLTGYVKNEPDGSVRIVARGETDQLQDLINWCHDGSPKAIVEDVSAKPYASVEEFKSFDIRY